MLDLYIVAAIAITMSAFTQGSLGFGFGMISVPTMLMIGLPPHVVIPLLIPLSLVLTVQLAWKVRHHFEFSLVVPLWIGAVIGLPIGVWILQHMDGQLLRLSAGAILIILPTMMLMGWSRPLPSRFYTLVPIGTVSAIMQGSISMSAPPIILFLANQGIDKDKFRANILLYFGGVGLIALWNFSSAGLYTGEVMKLFVILVCCVPIGGYIGTKLAPRIPQRLFRTLTLLVTAFLGAQLIIISLKALFFG